MRCTFVIRIVVLAAAIIAWPALVGTAQAQSSYPVSGTWTYENAGADGPAKDCGRRYMTFQGQQRFDTGGGVPSYRNVSIENVGDNEFRIVDAFVTGQISARSNYTLRRIDADHIRLQVSGQSILLRRCG